MRTQLELDRERNRLAGIDLDVATGESTADWVIQCVGTDASGAAGDAIESGVTFDAATGRLRGKLQCP